MKSRLKHRVGQTILCLYLGTVINIYIWLQTIDYFADSHIFKLILFFVAIGVYFVCFFLSGIIIDKIKNLKLRTSAPLKKKSKIKIFFIFFCISAIIALIWFAGYNPGGFSPDSISQYNQAINNTYNDWHPTLHTLFFFKIPLLFTQHPAAITLYQLLIFCTVLSYSLLTVYEIAGKKPATIFAILVLANPLVMEELMHPWKDVGFAIFSLLSLALALKVYTTNGTWGNKLSHIVFLAFILGCTTIFRHNGIFFTAPFIIGLFATLKRAQWIKLVVFVLAIIFIIKIPLYSLLQVSSPDKRIVETTGIPMAILGNIAQKNSQAMNEETTQFIYEIATPEAWSNNYVTGDFNSIKFVSNLNPIEDKGLFGVLGLTITNLIKSPIAGFEALFKATQVVYNLEPYFSYDVIPDIADNSFGISYAGSTTIKTATTAYRNLFDSTILRYFTIVGPTTLVMIIFIISRSRWKQGGWGKILLCSSVLIYDLGTMLLLTGPETRFFYINFITYPIIIILTMTPINTKNKATLQNN